MFQNMPNYDLNKGTQKMRFHLTIKIRELKQNTLVPKKIKVAAIGTEPIIRLLMV